MDSAISRSHPLTEVLISCASDGMGNVTVSQSQVRNVSQCSVYCIRILVSVNRHEALHVHDSCPLLVSYDSDGFKPLAPHDDGIDEEVSQKKDHQSTECRLPETSSVEGTETMTEPIGAEAKT